MDDENFFIAHNVLWNINTTRYKFYQSLYQQALRDRNINLQELLELGKMAGFSHNMSLDEIIGCLYANFLTIGVTESKYQITDRALLDFKIYKNDIKYKCCELPLTLDFTGSYIRLFTRPVDTLETNKLDFFRMRGWSRNKAQITLIKKIKNMYSLEEELQSVILATCNNDYYEGSFVELLMKYGRQRKYLKDYTANLNHRGTYSSKTFLKYKEYYQAIFSKTKKPIDWGGDAFDFCDIDLLQEKDIDKFVKESLADGMVRELSEIEKIKYQKKYTLTGHAYTIISSFLSEFHKKRLSIIVRPLASQGAYELLVGINSLYDEDVLSYLKNHFDVYDQGWVVCSNLDVQQVAGHIKRICECIIQFKENTIFDIYNTL